MLIAYRGNVSIVPGNHDWSNGKRSGKKAIQLQADFANSWFKGNSIVKNKDAGVFSTPPGLPGPTQITLSDQIDLIALDSQWWLQSKGPDPATPFYPTETALQYSLPEFGIRMPFKPTDFTQVNHQINRVLVSKFIQGIAA